MSLLSYRVDAFSDGDKTILTELPAPYMLLEEQGMSASYECPIKCRVKYFYLAVVLF